MITDSELNDIIEARKDEPDEPCDDCGESPRLIVDLAKQINTLKQMLVSQSEITAWVRSVDVALRDGRLSEDLNALERAADSGELPHDVARRIRRVVSSLKGT